MTASPSPPVQKSSDLAVAFSIASNVFTAVAIVIWNKYIVDVNGFRSIIFLSSLHYIFTGIGVRLMQKCGVFTYKEAPISSVIYLAAVYSFLFNKP